MRLRSLVDDWTFGFHTWPRAIRREGVSAERRRTGPTKGMRINLPEEYAVTGNVPERPEEMLDATSSNASKPTNASEASAPSPKSEGP
jgi:hypothetical protein